ncbi:hypothetical protein GCM10023149_43780 [Mucilaginibacter gynuensis]|uniref:DUF559 domain-containing protein n=1 Tax=Mucilaginibacter gynuensis TaxID=1302236 RepID=A0ABP8H7Z6_9SPHI
MKCLECKCSIYQDVYNYSVYNFNVPLCRAHQNWIKNHVATDDAIQLYFLLKENGVPAELEKFDGYKSVDIVIEAAKVHIEVDGGHHNYDKRQALADLKRTFHSFRRGYITLRIPNSLIRSHAFETADYITDFLELNHKRQANKSFSLSNLFKRL